MNVLNTVDTKSFNSVKEFLATNSSFQRVYFIPLDLKGHEWGCCPAYPSKDELLNSFGDDSCDYQIFTDSDCIKKSLIVYTRKAIKPGILFEEV